MKIKNISLKPEHVLIYRSTALLGVYTDRNAVPLFFVFLVLVYILGTVFNIAASYSSTIFFVGIYLIYKYILNRIIIRNIYKDRPGSLENLSYTFDEKGITYESNFQKVFASWKMVKKIEKRKDLLFVILDNLNGIIIPKSQFSDEEFVSLYDTLQNLLNNNK